MEQESNGHKGKGFAGLSSMISNVDEAIAGVKKPEDEIASAPSHSAESQPDRPSHSLPPRLAPLIYPSPAPPSEFPWAKWVLIGAVVIGAVVLVSTVGKRGSTSNTASAPSLPSSDEAENFSHASATASATQNSEQRLGLAPDARSRLTQDVPPVGYNNILTNAQIRYCLAEKIRLDGADAVANTANDSVISRFNKYVADYNSRCGEFRYGQGALESARSDVEQHREQLQADGRSLFSINSEDETDDE